jgi:lysophosphatidate acyltransferase
MGSQRWANQSDQKWQEGTRASQHSLESIILPLRRRQRRRPSDPLRMWIVTALFKPLAYVSVPYLILKYATDTNPIARYCFRVVVYYSALGLCSVWGMIVAAGMSLAGHRFDINWVVARSFYTLAGKLLDIRFVVEGEEHLDTKPAVLVANHQSGLDILLLGRYVHHRTHLVM